MEKCNFICLRVLKEITILSDGRITACCLDPGGKNTFANIYEENFEESIKKLQLFKEKLTEDPSRFPLCVQCFMSRKKKGEAAYDQFLKENPTGDEIDHYLKEEMVPKGLVIEVTTACNLTCIGCPTGVGKLDRAREGKSGKSIFINIDKLKAWLTPYIKKLSNIRLFNYGEPLCHSGVIDFCRFLTCENPRINLIIATNLLPLNNEKKIRDLVKAQPTMIIVSLHGANQESVVKYMGPHANFSLALQIMKKIIAERNRLGLTFPLVIWKYILFHWNDSDKELNEAKTLAKEHHIDYLGFEITGGELASKRFHRDSEDFNQLKKSDFFILNTYLKISKMKVKRRLGLRRFFYLIARWLTLLANFYKVLVKRAIERKNVILYGDKTGKKTVFFLHIPKCAGTTLNLEVLNKQFDSRKFILLYDYSMDEIIDHLGGMSEKEQKEIQCLSGHFYFGVHRYYSARPTTYITILREPIERVISHYYQVRRWKPHHLYKVVTEKNLTLKEYVESKMTRELNNGQTRILVGLGMNPPFGECTKEMLDRAKKNLENYFAAVGISEKFEDFLKLLHFKFGWKIPSYENLNVGDNRKRREDIDSGTIAVIEKYNQLDIELYRFAQDLFEEQYAKCS